MQQMIHTVLWLVLLVAPLPTSVLGTALRARSTDEPAEVSTPAEIKEKWNKMDDFLEIMFTLACKWKHGKDVNGPANEKLMAGEITRKEYDDFVMKTQADNVKAMYQSCGFIVADGEKKCREGCGTNWGNNMVERDNCDEKCVAVYDRFESECKAKVDNLESVYSIKMKATAAKAECHEGWCSEFPQVWMKEESAAKSEVETLCTDKCSEDSVEASCQKQWTVEMDFVKTGVTSDCHGETKVKSCFDEKKGTASSEEESCQSDGKGTCETQFTDCKDKGKTSEQPAEAEAFCVERKKMCEEQVTEKCLATFKKALEDGKTECEKESEDELSTCVTGKMDTKKTEFLADCKKEKSKSCGEDCREGCQVDKMLECLDNVGSDSGATEDFCKDFWQLLHESSEVDPVTGNPIVLLATTKANVAHTFF